MLTSLLLFSLAAVSCSAPSATPPSIMAGEWREFEGTWNAAGSRHTLAMGVERKSSTIELGGTMLLAGPGRPGIGFRAEFVGLVDSATGLSGRAVWTDERGDQVFSELTGQGTAATNRVEGVLVGGSGRYTGIEGSYAFSWQYVLEAEDGQIEGRAVGLTGRFRIRPPEEGARP